MVTRLQMLVPHTLVGVRHIHGVVTAEVKGAKDALEDLQKQPLTSLSVHGHKVADASITQPKVEAHAKAGKKGPPEEAVHEGELGIQHGGQLSKKYFMLFKDRLDYHDTKEDAHSGIRPKGRIALSEVNGYEAYGNGFILKLLGRSVGLHA